MNLAELALGLVGFGLVWLAGDPPDALSRQTARAIVVFWLGWVFMFSSAALLLFERNAP